ncbi:RAD9, HUS1, RAD1-interacting nuclear orphan protein 1 [Rhea pennata]|uniref:RAD9, HUS1, RAD1-interacting nuclear orphan protein 1 n=1 Tax=Rhea pennata TaxID=8795 RepID=UPI002E25AB19
MPPKKKCTGKARKAELVFLERPREGPIHSYESPLPLAENPRRVPTKPVDQSTSPAWVCPHFETSELVSLKGCQKKHCGPHKDQNQDASHGLLHPGGACRKAITCKFPPLAFETSEGHAVHSSDCLDHSRKNTKLSHRQSKKRKAAKANIQEDSPKNYREISSLPVAQHVEPEVSSSPDIQTPNLPSVRKWRCNSTLPQMDSHKWLPHNTLTPSIDPPGREDSATVLVTDTPEHEYGVRVTWRRRPHIMKYLRERGRLNAGDVFVRMNQF